MAREEVSHTENDIGPHEGRELELMLAGLKPLAMFTEIVPAESGIVPDEAFAPHVATGRIVMREILKPAPTLPNIEGKQHVRRVLYALPEEIWRIEAMLLLCEIYSNQLGWDDGLERMTGKLLGYEDRQIETFIKRVNTNQNNAAPRAVDPVRHSKTSK